MHRIDGPTAAPGGLFTEGSPTGGVPATVVTDDWLNDVQENIMAVLAAAGIAGTKGDYTDLLDALNALYSAPGLALGGVGASDYVSFKFADKTTGAERRFYFQWGTAVTNSAGKAIVTFPLAFPNNLLFALPVSGQNQAAVYGFEASTRFGATFPLYQSNTGSAVPAGVQMAYLAGGY